jgi:hypothetical protein
MIGFSLVDEISDKYRAALGLKVKSKGGGSVSAEVAEHSG